MGSHVRFSFAFTPHRSRLALPLFDLQLSSSTPLQFTIHNSLFRISHSSLPQRLPIVKRTGWPLSQRRPRRVTWSSPQRKRSALIYPHGVFRRRALRAVGVGKACAAPKQGGSSRSRTPRRSRRRKTANGHGLACHSEESRRRGTARNLLWDVSEEK